MKDIHVEFIIPVDDILNSTYEGLSAAWYYLSPVLMILAAAYLALYAYVKLYNIRRKRLKDWAAATQVAKTIRWALQNGGWESRGCPMRRGDYSVTRYTSNAGKKQMIINYREHVDGGDHKFEVFANGKWETFHITGKSRERAMFECIDDLLGRPTLNW
ncbi:hypothetical protein MYOV003v1_p0086 [Vibrio phage 207E48.1]|nr:hypothetical protein MYOV003v1_p0086 [Vibrio phage 207E48.1]